MNIQSYDFNLKGPGSTMMIDSDAQVIDFVDCTDPLAAIKVVPDLQQGGMALRLGQGFDAGSKVRSWLIVNASAGPISGTVVLSDSGFRNFRMFGQVSVLGTVGVSGNVSIIDGGRSRTLANQTFAGVTFQGVVAGNYPTVQIWNPANTGIRAVVTKVYVSSSVAQIVRIGSTTNAMTINGPVNSKLLGGATSKSVSANGALSGTPAGFAYLAQVSVPASGTTTYEWSEPIVIPPGYGLTAQGSQAASDLTMNIEFFEEPNT